MTLGRQAIAATQPSQVAVPVTVPVSFAEVDEHEVYSNPPVVLVALEVRHPTADPLSPAESRSIKKRLSKDFPIERPGQQVTFATPVALTPGATVPNLPVEHFPRFVNRATTISVSLRREAVVVETTDYRGWKDFSSLAFEALAARMDVAPVAGVERVGLRYINEIRVPGVQIHDWSGWVSPSLLSPEIPPEIGMPINQWQGVAVYGNHSGSALVLRYGPRDGYALDPNSDLRRVRPTPGEHFFLMDVDSFWMPEGTIPELVQSRLVEKCKDLHRPARQLFDSLITERLRDEVLHSDVR